METKSNTAERNTALVLQQYQSIKDKDMESFMSRCADDVVCVEANSMPVAGTYRGKADVERLLSGLVHFFDLSRLNPVRVVANDEFVVVMLEFHIGPPTDYKIVMSEWWQIRDGLIAEIRPFYWDTQELNDKLGGLGLG